MMLFRRGIVGISTKILLIFIAVTFVLWGLGTTDTLNNEAEWALKVGDVKFSPAECKHLINRASMNSEENNNELLRKNVIEDMIKSAVLLQEAKRLELFVSDDMVKNEIAHMQAFRDTNGKFDKNAFDQTIKNSGLSEIAFIEKVKEQMMRTQLVEFFYSSSSVVAPQFIDFTLKSMYGERIIKIFKLNTKAIDATHIPNPSDSDLINYVESNKESFEIPEKREISYAIIDAKALNEVPIITNEEIENQYNSNKDTIYKEPEKRTFQQIVLSSYEEANALLKELKGKNKSQDKTEDQDKNFDKIIASRSKIQSAPTELKEVTSSGFDNQIAKAIFSLEKGMISDPMQTPIGWHIFKVKEIYPSHVQNINEVKDAIIKQLKNEKIFHALNDLTGNIQHMVDNQKTWKEILDHHKLQTKNITLKANETLDTIAEPLLQKEEFLKAVFATDKISSVIPVDESGIFVLFNVNNIENSYLPDIKDIRNKAFQLWQQKQIQSKLFALSDEIRDFAISIKQTNIESGKQISIETQYRDLIKNNHLSIKEIGLSYVKPIPSDLPELMVNEIFDLNVGSFTSPYRKENEDEYYFALLLRIDSVHENTFLELKNRFGGNISRMYQEMLFNEYIRSMRKKYKVEINSNLLK